MKLDAEDRFWNRVRIGDGCWEWTGSLTTDGYGRVKFGHAVQRAHRVAWRLWRGPVASGLCALHRCDNRKCVRPGHLFLGTKADNSADMVSKGRQRPHRFVPRRGESNPMATLSDAEVARIRERVSAGETQRSVAREMGVSPSAISRIVTGARRAVV